MSRILEYGDSPDTAAFNTISPVQLRFRDLAIGQTFDFVDDSRRGYNSFFSRATKISARRYTWVTTQAGKPLTLTTRVGSINVPVYHVAE